MPRIEFDGKGEPIPLLALPPVGSDDSVAPTVLTFTENADFSVADYRTLGFTHFEAWTVGAAGGRGGDASSQLLWVSETVRRPVAQSIWDLVRERAALGDYLAQLRLYNAPTSGSGPWYKYSVAPVMNQTYKAWKYPDHTGVRSWVTNPNDDNVDPRLLRYFEVMREFGHEADWQNSDIENPWKWWQGTYLDLLEYHNPSHLLTFRTYKQVLLMPSMQGMGGGGGGGGFHHAAGALADLPDVVSIVVGKAGADAGYGQVLRNGEWAPGVADAPAPTGLIPYVDTFVPYTDPATYASQKNRIIEIENYLNSYLTSYPDPHSSLPNPQKGHDGGASSFADICEASGGEGGAAGMKWDPATAKFVQGGNGGYGGIGGRTAAGGGAKGSTAEGVNGDDGVWLPETGIGAGGGGGKGGRTPTTTGNPPTTPSVTTRHDATAGGQGSFSYADTSVYGQRQFRQPWTYLQPQSLPDSGVVTLVPKTETANLVAPGGGGGARPISNLKVGSRATGYSPNGVVVIRLMTITE